jgi:hypothetical protein
MIYHLRCLLTCNYQNCSCCFLIGSLAISSSQYYWLTIIIRCEVRDLRPCIYIGIWRRLKLLQLPVMQITSSNLADTNALGHLQYVFKLVVPSPKRTSPGKSSLVKYKSGLLVNVYWPIESLSLIVGVTC